MVVEQRPLPGRKWEPVPLTGEESASCPNSQHGGSGNRFGISKLVCQADVLRFGTNRAPLTGIGFPVLAVIFEFSERNHSAAGRNVAEGIEETLKRLWYFVQPVLFHVIDTFSVSIIGSASCPQLAARRKRESVLGFRSWFAKPMRCGLGSNRAPLPRLFSGAGCQF